ncbi:6-phosphogluconate dehydrogenase, NADP(+)-dependent, decarboxylating [compost metagenome]
MLEDIYQAYKKQPALEHLYADESIQQQLKDILPGTRKVVGNAIQNGFAIPALASALTYFDSLRTANSALNLTQAQRDFFGAHTFERTDEEGIFHADWNSNNL